MSSLIPTWSKYLLVIGALTWFCSLLIDYGRKQADKDCHITQTDQALSTSEDRRAEEGATTTKRTEASDEHIQAVTTLVEQRNAAGVAAERLRHQLADTVRVAQRCTQDDPAAEQSRAAVAAIGAVFAACETEYRAVAEEAAERYATGIHAERDYDALTAAGAEASGASPASSISPDSSARVE